MHIHLVDGTWELFRCFYGAPSRTNDEGIEIGAVRALCGTLLSLLREPEVTHVAVAFDTVIESFRNELFAGYKTGAGIDPALFSQFPLAERATRALGLVTWSMIEFEADDAIATGAWRFARAPGVERVVVCSPDKDLAQCVGDGPAPVVQVDRKQGKLFDTAGVRERLGVAPTQVPDLLALVGDDADGIPGLPGFGAKTAAALLQRFGSLEAIPDDGAAWGTQRGAARLAATLCARRDDARLYRTLATLRADVPLREGIGELRWRGPDVAALQQVAEQLRDPRLVERATEAAAAKGGAAQAR